MTSSPRFLALALLLGCSGGDAEGQSAAACIDDVDQDLDGDVDCDDRGCADDWAVCDNGASPLVINEFVANNAFGITDENGEYEDWIELYNASDEAFSLEGLTITDDLAIPAKVAFNSGLNVPAHGWLKLWADQDTTPTHLGFKLAREGGAIALFDADGEPIDAVVYGEQAGDVAYARIPDGWIEWTSTANATPEASNGGGP